MSMRTARKVIVIPEKPELQKASSLRQQRVAAYCRVSTEEEEQQSSYENQCNYYTDLIIFILVVRFKIKPVVNCIIYFILG